MTAAPPFRRATPLLAAAAVLAVGLAACIDDPEPAPTQTAVPPPVVTEPTAEPTGATTAPTAEPTTPGDVPTAEETDPAVLPPFEPGGTPQRGEPSGEPLLPVAVRVGEHRGFERIVVELQGTGTPGWQTEYVAEAIEDGSGNRVDVDGDAVLSVYVSGTRYPEEGEDHPARHVVDGEDLIEEVHFLGTFEGLTQIFVGVDDGVADYRVFTLADPARLVIDIEDRDR